ncbi:MBL fold metallo-hydrolase [Undibacterium sp.]|uniref:MBL fold metallo-hydrolase n=1 Tax=Undibacterium sp. TaxID=1914977 RepID=UPI0025FCFA46|nr:MBL fold metallo-hydrolase [Undibacterium sp.]
MQPQIQSFFDPVTNTISHVVYDHPGGHAAVIDPVLDFDAKSGRTSTVAADRIAHFLLQQELHLVWILETHAHADHLSSAKYLQRLFGGKIAIGAHIGQVQSAFKRLFNLEPEFAVDGSQFDVLLHDDEVFQIGQLQARAMLVPGHTPADMAYQVGDAVFIGDTLFMPDTGTARCDFPGGDAQQLYRSIQKIFALPGQTRLFLCHDYPPAGRSPQMLSTVAEQRAANIHVHDGIAEAAFIALRLARDATLAVPQLILPAVQVNIRAGAFPAAESNGISYLKIPLNTL